tara:strand:+ start:561 stop:842 length:282 start_codon:yes stop_codon:yes gene_type:complete
MKQFKDNKELAEWVYDMHLQNTNGRETHEEMFKLGIENTIEELTELNLLGLFSVSQQRELLNRFFDWEDMIFNGKLNDREQNNKYIDEFLKSI